MFNSQLWVFPMSFASHSFSRHSLTFLLVFFQQYHSVVCNSILVLSGGGGKERNTLCSNEALVLGRHCIPGTLGCSFLSASDPLPTIFLSLVAFLSLSHEQNFFPLCFPQIQLIFTNALRAAVFALPPHPKTFIPWQ